MGKKASTYTLIFSLIASQACLGAEVYLVKAGDTLSEIAAKHLGAHQLYKPRTGSLARVIAANQEIRDPDRIFPGQKIYFEKDNAIPSVAIQEPFQQEETRIPASAPEAECIPAATAIPLVSEYPVTHLEADLGFEYFKLDTKDIVNGGSATILSDMNPQVRFTWDLDWSEQWTSRMRLSYIAEKAIKASSATSTVSGGDTSKFGFEFGAIRHWNKASRSGFSIASSPESFPRAQSATSITLDKVQTLKFTASHELDVVTVNTAAAGVGLSLSGLMGATGVGYSTKFGWEPELSMYLKHELAKSNVEIKGQVYYGITHQNSTTVEKTESRMGLFLGLSRRWNE